MIWISILNIVYIFLAGLIIGSLITAIGIIHHIKNK